MKKRVITAVLSVLTAATMLVGCGGSDNTSTDSGAANTGAKMKVGMVTDAGTIDDKSFNQGTWEGIEKAKAELGVDDKYLKPAGTTEADYTKEIGNLYDAGYKFIVTPGYKFETAVFQTQSKYEDAKFVILDGAPHNGDFNPQVAENTVSIFFAEHESGFLAGLATALELKEGALGFIGGMKIPAVQKFNWGFQQGVAYANENCGTNMTLEKENIMYQGTFDSADAGQQIAATMYDRGVKAIFTAAGGTGSGVITEAKTRASKGEEVWVIGVDVDQYAEGIYDAANNKSAILTSAMKCIDAAAFDMIKAELDGNFPGGQTLTFDAKNDGIGIPKENPNLSEETTKKVAEVFEKIKSGEVKVASEQGSLVE